MKIDILPIIPRPIFGFGEKYIRREGVVTIEMHPQWYNVGQNISYRKFVFSLRWPITFQFQIHLTRYKSGSWLSEHVDEIHEKERQFRLVLVLKKAKQGGELLCEHFITNRSRLKLFEPCKYKHEVTRVEEGERIVALIGIRYAFHTIRPCPF